MYRPWLRMRLRLQHLVHLLNRLAWLARTVHETLVTLLEAFRQLVDELPPVSRCARSAVIFTKS